MTLHMDASLLLGSVGDKIGRTRKWAFFDPEAANNTCAEPSTVAGNDLKCTWTNQVVFVFVFFSLRLFARRMFSSNDCYNSVSPSMMHTCTFPVVPLFRRPVTVAYIAHETGKKNTRKVALSIDHFFVFPSRIFAAIRSQGAVLFDHFIPSHIPYPLVLRKTVPCTLYILWVFFCPISPAGGLVWLVLLVNVPGCVIYILTPSEV